MLYNAQNARGATVVDMDSRKVLDLVMEVNTRAGWVKVGHDLMRLDAKGRFIGERIRVGSIYAIQGLESQPSCSIATVGSHDHMACLDA